MEEGKKPENWQTYSCSSYIAITPRPWKRFHSRADLDEVGGFPLPIPVTQGPALHGDLSQKSRAFTTRGSASRSPVLPTCCLRVCLPWIPGQPGDWAALQAESRGQQEQPGLTVRGSPRTHLIALTVEQGACIDPEYPHWSPASPRTLVSR